MEFNIPDGISHSLKLKVEKRHTAKAVGSGGIDIFSTPSLVALMEQAALEAVRNFLPEGWTTVGTRIDIEHRKATLVGKEVRAEAILIQAEGRALKFLVEAHDADGIVGKGRHHRFIVNRNGFLRKLRESAGNVRS